MIRRVFHHLKPLSARLSPLNCLRFKTCLPSKLLFTPGPLSVTQSVRDVAAKHDMGSRDHAFIKTVQEIRDGTVQLAEVDPADFTMVPMQGSGTFGIEAVITTAVPSDGTLLVVANGAYGQRMQLICEKQGINHITMAYTDNEAPDLKEVAAVLESRPEITHVACVHSETTSGIVNDIQAIGELVEACEKSFIVDAMSSFGGIPIDMASCHIDWLVTSANKCIQGIPGFSVVVVKKACLHASEGNARSLALDLVEQEKGLEKNGQFRFTPPTHVIMAFKQALDELKLEGGVEARCKRYESNKKIVIEGMRGLGFKPYLAEEHRGPIITTFKFPADPNWDFEEFYNKLNERGFVIYPGKVTHFDCFRIGHIGDVSNEASELLVKAVKEVCDEMGIKSCEP